MVRVNERVLFAKLERIKESLYELHHEDAFAWLADAAPCSVHAVVTDPPYGFVEYSQTQLRKLRNGAGGVWRLPLSFDGSRRRPVPRFTVLRERDEAALRGFFGRLAEALHPVLVPGAHVFIATNPLLCELVFEPWASFGARVKGAYKTTSGNGEPAGSGDCPRTNPSRIWSARPRPEGASARSPRTPP